ncbi:MAG: F0F1 ATP synthase subunit B [Gemmatimonadota bacterium]|nr:F0F1 ATP synthase subunit B [Gemmatimonadota bacterium]MDE3007062.1 F0F1 ATP synthase subunit B [Gemmatimonadota bacterium]MDE3013021.1 F0F1 ATP synthase subunit B [Gemmatimonadota bacterium]
MRLSRITAAALALAVSPAGLFAQGGEGGGGLYDINTGLSFWTLVVFGILVFILGKYAWGPILAAVDAREKGIQSALDEAAERNDEAAKLLAEHKEQLADARRQANELLAEGKAAGETVRKEIEEKARVEAQAIIERARAEIERERDAAIAELRKESVDLALAAATRLIQENLDQDKDRALVERYLTEMGSGGGAA